MKKNRIIHIEVQEGQLLPRGLVNSTTLHWREASPFKLLDRGIKNTVDYHTMSWDKRAIDLDDLMAPQSHIVTGVRFRIVGTHLNLEIRVTEMNFEKGKLMDPESTSIWVSNDNTDSSPNKRTPVQLTKPDVPTSPTFGKSVIDSSTNQYIEFTHTDLDRDASQTTVPFLDAQEVTSLPAFALAGAGIHHKGQKLSGGFVALKLITYDMGQHIQTPQPNDEDDLHIVTLH